MQLLMASPYTERRIFSIRLGVWHCRNRCGGKAHRLIAELRMNERMQVVYNTQVSIHADRDTFVFPCGSSRLWIASGSKLTISLVPR